MVVKEEILNWFKRQQSHQRLDVLLSILDFCLPFELRFAANCIEVLIKRDAFTYQDNEVVAAVEKNATSWDPGTASLSEEAIRRKLILTLALNPPNRILNQTVFKLLCSSSASQYLQLLDVNAKPPVSCSSLSALTSTYHEVLLIYTMAMYHPSFTLDERMKLTSNFVYLQNLAASVEQLDLRENVTREQTPSKVDKQTQSQVSYQQSKAKSSHSPRRDGTCDKDQPPASPSKRFHNNHRYPNNRRTVRSFSNSAYETNMNARKPDVTNGEINHNPNTMNCSNGSGYLTPQLRDQMGREKFKKFWSKLDQYSLSQLLDLSDEQLHKIGLTSHLIARLRKVLRRNVNLEQPARHSPPNGVCNTSAAERLDKLRYDSTPEDTPSSQPQQQQQSPVNNTLAKSSAMIKSLTGPPNVLPPFSSSSSSSSSQQHPPSSIESLSSSSSSMETPSPPASRSSSPVGKGARRRPTEQQRVPPLRPMGAPPNAPATLRPRLPFSGSLNLPYIRPSNTGNVLPMNAVRPQHQQPSGSRGNSQPRDLSLNPMAVPLPGSQPSGAYMVANSTPPPNLEMPPIPVYSCHGYISLGGTGSAEPVSGLVATQPFGQPPFTYMTSALPSATSPGTPMSNPYANTSFYIHNPILAQPVAPPPSGANTNGRPSIEYPAFVSQGPFLYARPDFDFTRPPPPGTVAPVATVSCYNCGGTGHRGNECREFSLEDVIKPASA